MPPKGLEEGASEASSLLVIYIRTVLIKVKATPTK